MMRPSALLVIGPAPTYSALPRRPLYLGRCATGRKELPSTTGCRERAAPRGAARAHPDHYGVGRHLMADNDAITILQRNLLPDRGRRTRELGVKGMLVFQAAHQTAAGA